MSKRHPANGQSGGRGADVWVVLGPEHVAWLARNEGGSLSVMSVDGEVVRLSNFASHEQMTLDGQPATPTPISPRMGGVGSDGWS